MTPSFGDRTMGLRVFGLLLVATGLLSSCVSLLVLLPLIQPMPFGGVARPNAAHAVGSCLSLIALAGLLTTLGIGSLGAKRWVRPLVLSIAWIWLIAGVLTTVLQSVMLPRLLQQLTANTAPLPGPVLGLLSIVLVALMALVYIALPAALILFYRSPDVQRTCERRHPRPVWTDRCPTRVLAISVSLVLFATLILASLGMAVVPLFGLILTGTWAWVCMAVGALAMVWLAVTTARLRMSGWWGTVVLFVLLTVGPLPTMLRHDLPDLYAAMGMGEAELQIIRPMVGGPLVHWLLIATLVVVGAGSVGYMFTIRRYFAVADTTTRGGSGA